MPPNSSSENTTRHLFVNFFFQHNISYHMYKLWNQFSCYPRLKPMSYYYDPFLNTYSLNCFRVYHLGEDNKITLECHWVITILQNCDGLTLWESEWAIKQGCLLKADSFLWQYVLGFTCWANLYFNFFFFFVTQVLAISISTECLLFPDKCFISISTLITCAFITCYFFFFFCAQGILSFALACC